MGDEGRQMAADAATKIKRTFYLDRDSVVALAEIQAAQLRSTGHKPDLSALVIRAIELLRRSEP